jgi:hypothetical protein
MTKRCVLLVASTTLLALIVPCCAVCSQNQPGKTNATESGAARSNAAASQVFSSGMYGVKFVYPPVYNFEAKHYAYLANPDFANDEGAVILGTVEIPAALYTGTNFSGGKFAVSVSPVITNIAACDQFASGEPESTVTVNGILYSVANNGTGGLGHWQSYKILHTYQNGFCYEFMFEIDGYNRGSLEDPSSVQEFSDAPKIQDTLLAGISFFRPAAKPPLQTAGRPKILSFSPSSDVAGVGIHNSITFSWKSQYVDYVRLQFSCAQGAVIVADGYGAQCGSYATSPNQSPDDSKKVIFGNSNLNSPEGSPIPVTVTLVPFANGVAYPDLSKSVTITIPPYNAFPEGVPTSDMKMSLTVQPTANNEFRFAHGSTVNLRWTVDATVTLAPCTNLYLVHDNKEGGEMYVYKLSQPCLGPRGGNGSFSWTIPENFSGDGFHVLGATPGGMARALSHPFSIY